MRIKALLFISCALVFISTQREGEAKPSTTQNLAALSTNQLEERLDSIETELTHLSRLTLRNGTGAIGYRSPAHSNRSVKEWVQINLGQPRSFDQIIIIPSIANNSKSGIQTDSFPAEFRVLIGTDENDPGKVLAHITEGEIKPENIAPFIIDCPETHAAWIRVEALKLTTRLWDGLYCFELAEVLVFEHQENIALNADVISSSGNVPHPALGRDPRFVVDGFTPYIMDASQGKQSRAFIGFIQKEADAYLMLDLEQNLPINRIQLHSVDLSDTIPTSVPADFGIPRHLRIEGAKKKDFSDARLITEYRIHDVYDTGPVMVKSFPEKVCRYIRFKVIEPYQPLKSNQMPFIGFAEVEVFSRGKNVALGTKIEPHFITPPLNRPIEALTDGRNYYGIILSMRDWLGELTRRNALEAERPQIHALLKNRYTQQKRKLKHVSWLAGILAVSIAFILLIERILHMRDMARARERFAADVHDELGGQIHSIALLGDLLKDTENSPEEIQEIADEIRALSFETSVSARYCSNMLEAPHLYEDVPAEMKRISQQLLADLEHTMTLSAGHLTQKLTPRKRIDLLLFYRESLTNILRHSHCTAVHTELKVTEKTVSLVVTDNGTGLSGNIPDSLKRRARLLSGQFKAEDLKAKGTRITLQFKFNQWSLLK